ncbi:probably inactive leucine-rich repeat receptor-like protein kinase At5g06940 [Phalaenopsis equestris]|uniref:probably inactive leucine-rich repeat receptor-like protein kinase At5g06940 n=1 Tax=Phalaenopsis equestris TaxID=78828 RepID=UPI0009E27DFC|nr:probably inactive leucine-rich repeat receptor-like protein kinase At5g06940 [Phalaenopsis equestris]
MAADHPIPLFLHLTLTLSLIFAAVSVSETDILLAFKSSIEDPNASLLSWFPNSTDYCNWTGVTCSSLSPPSPTSLNLQSLNLSGEISPSICQLPNLQILNLANNRFNQPIPLLLSQCTSLRTLNLSNNVLWGTLPDQITHLSSLKELDLSNNRIQGQMPLSLGLLDGLQVLNLGSNLFSGTVHPPIFRNLSDLVVLDLSKNPSLTSKLPTEIGRLGKLRKLLLQSSDFYGEIPESFQGLHELQFLDLSQNNLNGRVPKGLGLGMTNLVSVDLSQNMLSGSFPSDICYGKALVELSLHENFLTGPVPESISNCNTLQRFQVQDNMFSGIFPPGLWSLSNIALIRAENNQFSGEIPDLVGVGSKLEQVQIDNNSFTGRIPHSLGQIHTMYRFSASLNGLDGNLPENFCDSPVMSIINLSHNSLSGSIPEFRNCIKLVYLSLADNKLTGNIPSSLAQLAVLTYIDLSSNDLSGEIPPELQNLKLALFNVSYNQLSGSVPLYITSGLPASYLQGNPGLCGPGLPNTCSLLQKSSKSKSSKLLIVVVALTLTAVVMILAVIFFTIHRMSGKKWSSSAWKPVFFGSLGVSEDEIIMALDDKNIIGRGPFGRVHIIQLPDGDFVAVKKLMSMGAVSLKRAKNEIKTLAKARHKNLTKFLGFCYSDTSVLLIHEYVKKGSLGDALLRSELPLEWRVRLQIALGTAQGLAYLHKDYVPHLLHRNVKSNNILLDEDFRPKLTGYGLDRVTGEASYQACLASELGSFCYIAPEQSYSKKATEQMDVYSFGVVLLELITGRPAEQPDSRESVDVVKWVRRKINMRNGPNKVLDPKVSDSSHREMLGALDLALNCTAIMPEKRPGMDEVVRTLQLLNDVNEPLVISSVE